MENINLLDRCNSKRKKRAEFLLEQTQIDFIREKSIDQDVSMNQILRDIIEFYRGKKWNLKPRKD